MIVQLLRVYQKKWRWYVEKYGGSLSAKHGDGRLRSKLMSYTLGESMIPVLSDVKRLFDPDGLFNP